jgi:hypothetical protein
MTLSRPTRFKTTFIWLEQLYWCMRRLKAATRYSLMPKWKLGFKPTDRDLPRSWVKGSQLVWVTSSIPNLCQSHKWNQRSTHTSHATWFNVRSWLSLKNSIHTSILSCRQSKRNYGNYRMNLGWSLYHGSKDHSFSYLSNTRKVFFTGELPDTVLIRTFTRFSAIITCLSVKASLLNWANTALSLQLTRPRASAYQSSLSLCSWLSSVAAAEKDASLYLTYSISMETARYRQSTSSHFKRKFQITLCKLKNSRLFTGTLLKIKSRETSLYNLNS